MGGKLASGVHIRFAHTKEVLKGISLVSIFFFFFFIKHLYPGYPTRLEAVTNVGSCTTYFVTQTIGL